MRGAAFNDDFMSQSGEFGIVLIDAVNIASLNDNTSLHGLYDEHT